MSGRVRFAVYEAKLSVELLWTVDQADGSEALEAALNARYGVEWESDTLAYHPSPINARVLAAAEELGGEILEEHADEVERGSVNPLY